jgi:hypothetical protein
MNKVKLFWTCILLVIFLGYTYFYNYGGKEGLKMSGEGFANSLKRDVRITAQTINDDYGPTSIKHALTRQKYGK